MCHFHPRWYIAVATVISLYQAYRGFRLQWVLGIRIPPLGYARWHTPEALVPHVPPVLLLPNQPVRPASQLDKVILLCIADALTFFVCAATGFEALLRLKGIASGKLATIQDHGVLAAFLLLYGVSGITGKLPEGLAKISSKLS